MKKLNILIADDDALVVSALKTILSADGGLNVVANAANGEEAVALFKSHRPNVCLFDIRMGEKSGLDAAEEIFQEDKNACILLLTTFSDDEYILKALKIGVAGYMLKQDFDKIVPSIYAAAAGQSILGGEIVARLPKLMNNNFKAGLDSFGLDEREKEITELVANGFSNREIAEKIFLSEGTVRNYLSTVLEKLALRDRTQLAVFYYKNIR